MSRSVADDVVEGVLPVQAGDWRIGLALQSLVLDRMSLNAIKQHFVRHGFGLWALELIGISDFIGVTGFSVPSFEAHFTPCAEIAWRLARDYWGFGYATEGRLCSA
jgi:RimJ/RimL family protein N-acetyltransferase